MNRRIAWILSRLLSSFWLLQAGGNSALRRGSAPEFPGQGGHPSLALILAVVLALPAVGMLAIGFALHRPWLGGAGVAMFVGMTIFYSVVARLVLSRLE